MRLKFTRNREADKDAQVSKMVASLTNSFYNWTPSEQSEIVNRLGATILKLKKDNVKRIELELEAELESIEALNVT